MTMRLISQRRSAAANERLLVRNLARGELTQIESLFVEETCALAVLELERDAERAHQAGIGRHDDRFADEGGHRHRHGAVVADAALHEDLPADGAVALDAVRVVHADRVDEAGDDVFALDALVGGVLDVA